MTNISSHHQYLRAAVVCVAILTLVYCGISIVVSSIAINESYNCQYCDEGDQQVDHIVTNGDGGKEDGGDGDGGNGDGGDGDGGKGDGGDGDGGKGDGDDGDDGDNSGEHGHGHTGDKEDPDENDQLCNYVNLYIIDLCKSVLLSIATLVLLLGCIKLKHEMMVPYLALMIFDTIANLISMCFVFAAGYIGFGFCVMALVAVSCFFIHIVKIFRRILLPVPKAQQKVGGTPTKPGVKTLSYPPSGTVFVTEVYPAPGTYPQPHSSSGSRTQGRDDDAPPAYLETVSVPPSFDSVVRNGNNYPDAQSNKV